MQFGRAIGDKANAVPIERMDLKMAERGLPMRKATFTGFRQRRFLFTWSGFVRNSPSRNNLKSHDYCRLPAATIGRWCTIGTSTCFFGFEPLP